MYNVDSFSIKANSMILRVLLAILVSSVTSIIPLLLTPEDVELYTSFPFYVTVVVLFWAIILFRYFGILIGFVTFLIFGLVFDLEIYDLVVNTLVNTLQLYLLYVGYKFVRNLEVYNKNKYTRGVFYLSVYNFLIIISLIVYFCAYIFTLFDLINTVSIIAVFLLFMTLIKARINKDLSLLIYTFAVSLLPSIVCSVISALCTGVFNENIFFDYVLLWSCSNYILLQSIGYIIYQYTYRVYGKNHSFFSGLITRVSFGTIAYYIAMLIWNILIIYLYMIDTFSNNYYLFFFPWVLGNVLLGANLIFSNNMNQPDKNKSKFEWYEGRVIVVETNTSTIITIIAFLLPLSLSFIDSMSVGLRVIFISNIFAACMSIGLIWVPNTNVRFISLLQDVKTIFYIYSILLLLLSSMLIIFSTIV